MPVEHVSVLILASLLVAAVGSVQLLREPTARAAGRRPGPLLFWLFGGVCALLFANQLVVAAVFAATGRPEELRHFPPGWFRVLEGPAFEAAGAWLVAHPGALGVAELSVLRVNAFLELPFALLAALCAIWLVGPRLVGLVLRPLPWGLACVCWTATFVALELLLENPWTGGDLVLRVVAGLACLAAQPTLARVVGPGSWRARVVDLPRAIESGVAVALLSGVCVVICTLTLVYDLGDTWLFWLLVPSVTALGVLVRVLAQEEERTPSGGFAVVEVAAARFAVAFFPVAIPLRYAWPGFGAGVVLTGLVVAALFVGLATDKRSAPRNSLLLGAAAVVAWTDGFGLLDGPWLIWPDLLMLQRASLFVGCALVGTWLLGLRRRSLPAA